MTAASDGNNAVTWNWIEHEKLTLRLNTVGFAARNPGSLRWQLQFQLLLFHKKKNGAEASFHMLETSVSVT